jgi:hypothetical protein
MLGHSTGGGVLKVLFTDSVSELYEGRLDTDDAIDCSNFLRQHFFEVFKNNHKWQSVRGTEVKEILQR